MLFGLKLVEKYIIQNNTSCSVYKKWCAQPEKKSADYEKSNKVNLKVIRRLVSVVGFPLSADAPDE